MTYLHWRQTKTILNMSLQMTLRYSCHCALPKLTRSVHNGNSVVVVVVVRFLLNTFAIYEEKLACATFYLRKAITLKFMKNTVQFIGRSIIPSDTLSHFTYALCSIAPSHQINSSFRFVTMLSWCAHLSIYSFNFMVMDESMPSSRINVHLCCMHWRLYLIHSFIHSQYKWFNEFLIGWKWAINHIDDQSLALFAPLRDFYHWLLNSTELNSWKRKEVSNLRRAGE